jgi:hypothetical protein
MPFRADPRNLIGLDVTVIRKLGQAEAELGLVTHFRGGIVP